LQIGAGLGDGGPGQKAKNNESGNGGQRTAQSRLWRDGFMKLKAGRIPPPAPSPS
jgi:hypothetical protein